MNRSWSMESTVSKKIHVVGCESAIHRELVAYVDDALKFLASVMTISTLLTGVALSLASVQLRELVYYSNETNFAKTEAQRNNRFDHDGSTDYMLDPNGQLTPRGQSTSSETTIL